MLPTIERRNMKSGLMGGNPGFAHFSCGTVLLKEMIVCVPKEKKIGRF